MLKLQPNLPASNPNRPIYGGASFLVAHQLKQKHVLVVGSGREAANRTFFALDADAFVTVISPGKVHPAVQDRIKKGLVRFINRNFQDSDLDLKWEGETSSPWPVDMVLGCIDDEKESRRIALLARSKRILVNCADIPNLCDFYFMAQYRQDKLQLAVSTNGGGPRLGVQIRNKLVESLDPHTPKAVTVITNLRERIREIDLKDNSLNIQQRMGWISRFCDAWNYEDLAQLDNPTRFEQVVQDYVAGKPIPLPPKTQKSTIKPSFKLPDSLTSFYYCPQNMGYIAWIQMYIDYSWMIVYQLLSLMWLHFKLVFSIPKRLLNFQRKPSNTGSSESVGRVSTSGARVVRTPLTVESLSAEDSCDVQMKDLKELNSPPVEETNTGKIEVPVVSITENGPAIPEAVIGTSSVSDEDKDTIVASEQVNNSIVPAVAIEDTTVDEDQETSIAQDELNYPIESTKSTLEAAKVTFAEDSFNQNTDPKQTSNEISQYFDANNKGKLYLCGAGPGNPDLLTLEAHNLIRSVDLVVSDRLIPQDILNLIPPQNLILSSFKLGGESDKSQNESNQICLEAVLQGKSVLRLKTGDPFVFGRGGEEVLFFRSNGIEPVVVCGLSSVFAGPTSVLIPVTHRDVADQVLILSGRGKNGGFPMIPKYYASRTIVVLMSLTRLAELVQRFIETGHPRDLPCCVIEKATWKEGQQTCFAPLHNIAKKVEEQSIKNPAMLILGHSTLLLNPK